MLQRHIHCQRSVQHALQIVLVLREDGDTVPEAVSKWADESNWMGGDAVVLSADTAEVEPFHRVFRRPLSALRADPNPLVAPTVLARASDSRHPRQSELPRQAPGLAATSGLSADNTSGVGSGKEGGAVAGLGWSKRGFTFAGGGGGGGVSKKGVRDVMAKFKKGRKLDNNGASDGGGDTASGMAASVVVMTGGGGPTNNEPQTVLRVTILEAEGLRNVAVLKKTDSYVSAHLATRTEVREGRTSVKKNTCDPKWNEPLSFTVPTGTLVDAQLFLKVVGKQKVRDDIILGRVELPLAGINSADPSAVIGEASSAGGGGARDAYAADGGRWFALEEGQGRLKIDAELVKRRPSLIV
ncbi:unnamed protein product [Sphacelaria rigidula]